MKTIDSDSCRYFISYSGVKLPLNLINEISQSDTENRNTYFCGHYDSEGKMIGCEKRVYGALEFEHRYSYHSNGMLKQAAITHGGDEPQCLDFPES